MLNAHAECLPSLDPTQTLPLLRRAFDEPDLGSESFAIPLENQPSRDRAGHAAQGGASRAYDHTVK